MPSARQKNETRKKMFDKEVTRQQIQSLNDLEAIMAFFAYLGYDTNTRIQQTPANLGITSETIQRQIKRIKRIAEQQIYNMFPDEGLERLLRLLESLIRKISNIDRTGFLDASVLGEVVHPQSFNTLRRIRDKDNSVIEEEEGFIELTSNEFLMQHLRQLLEAGGV